MEKDIFIKSRCTERDLEAKVHRFMMEELRPLIYTKVIDLEVEYAYSKEPVEFKEIKNLKFKKIKEGDVWAEENFACAWFHVTGHLPKDENRDNLYIDFEDQGEALLVDKNGSSIKGFTSGSFIWGSVDYDTVKQYYKLDDFIDEDGNIEYYIDAASNSLFGDFNKQAVLNSCRISRRNEEAYALFMDFDSLMSYFKSRGWMREEETSTKIIHGLRNAMNQVAYSKDLKKAKEITEELINLPGDETLKMVAVGHAHLDLAWLWPIRETKRKALRTFANTVYLSEKYPDYVFVVSQPQQLEWTKELDPTLYAKVKELVKKGNIEIIGGGWVESDTNMPSEESLVRQELYGQKFWMEEFGKYVDVKWLPDTFGYTGAMPQILKLSGQKYFMTIKISWGTFTIFPYQTFNWKGIDGTSVTVHMPPQGTYNSHASVQELFDTKNGIKKTDPKDECLLVYGIGDGGAGPSEIMEERLEREEKMKYVPNVKMGHAQDFFHRIDSDSIPTYQGEMYLEKHRATYTSQSNNKNFNREMEGRLLSLEAALASKGIFEYKKEIDKIWKEMLLYQFHDILPGSSIQRVYEETDAAYGRLFGECEKLVEKIGYSYEPKEDRNLINPYNENVEKAYKKTDGYLVYSGSESSISPLKVEMSSSVMPDVIHTDYYDISFNEDGSFKSVSLKEDGFELLKDSNKIRVFIDRGDAWDFEDDYREQPEVYMNLDSTNVAMGKDLVEITFNYSFKESKIKETILINKHSKLIEVKHDCDWKNVGYMVRSEIYPTVYSDTVHSDIQFGYLDRATTDNTDHEKSQFEISCQKWFDISNEKYGLSVINNAKCGFMAKNGMISLDLLRSTNYPCITSEFKHISYNYAFYPHKDGFDPIEVDDLAYMFNGRYLFGKEEIQAPKSSNGCVEITAFKPSYDESGFIVRLFEREGKKNKTTITLPEGYALDCMVNLLEDEIGDASLNLEFEPFEIKTLKLKKTK